MRLASSLTGWEIDILTEEAESERRQAEVQQRSQTFIDALDVDDVIAQFLVSEGFTSVEEVAYVPEEELISIEGFDAEVAEELRLRARNYLTLETERLATRVSELAIDENLKTLDGLTLEMVVTLGESKIKTLEDFADLASDELTGAEDGILREYGVKPAVANELILRARVAAGWISQEDMASALVVEENEDVGVELNSAPESEFSAVVSQKKSDTQSE